MWVHPHGAATHQREVHVYPVAGVQTIASVLKGQTPAPSYAASTLPSMLPSSAKGGPRLIAPGLTYFTTATAVRMRQVVSHPSLLSQHRSTSAPHVHRAGGAAS